MYNILYIIYIFIYCWNIVVFRTMTESWTIAEVGNWLNSSGLQPLVQRFAGKNISIKLVMINFKQVS